MSNNFAKLISEKELVTLISGKITKENLINIFLKPSIEQLYDYLSDDILLAKLIKPHFYRFSIQIHAQEKE